jgi:hypothetical protein
MSQTLGVHYQTWRNRPAVNYVLENFRKYYPNAPVRMVSDNGEDFSDLAQKYNCVFDFENVNIFPKGILVGHPMSGVTDIEPLGAYVWLRRLYDTCKVFDTDWIVIMEDDVLTRGVVSSFPSTHAGGVVSFPLTPLLTAFLMGRNLNNKTWGYGLCGGGIINRSFFVNAYEKYIQEFDLKFISNFDGRVYGWSDILLTVFIIYAGGTYSVWNDVEDKKHNFRPDAAFEHDVKQFYTETSQGSLNK